ncbi:MAG: hypothetical protein JW741_04165 [Sedimentisphaerales bacterium]|nr:hypothetical protein [Sedimentisphaerales bacterium]
MSDERLKELLQRADEAAGAPVFRQPHSGEIRRRVFRRRLKIASLPAAAVLLIGAGVATLCLRPARTPPPQQRIATVEAQLRQLQTQTDAVLKLVHEVLEKDRQEGQLATLEAELASIPDPEAEIERQVDKAAFTMLYQADRLYKQLRQTDSAVEAYKEIIQLFPENQWADVARERLSQIQEHRINNSNTKGERKCEPRRV